MTHLIALLIDWVSIHPELAGLLVAIIACVESLAFVGMLVPGTVMILGAGALIGAGALQFWPIMAWAVGGAVLGDGVSYWFGHHYHERLRTLGPLRRRPELLTRGERFFERHGGKSVVLARFVGPVRPVIPVVAGMLGMPALRFYVYNVVSALLWAPTHLIPGMVFGASLTLAGQVAGRLALGLGVLIIGAWAVIVAAHAGYRRLQPQAGRWAAEALTWARQSRRFRRLVGDLLDPTRPVSGSLLLWLCLLIGGVWLFLGVLEDVLHLDPMVYAGQAIYHFLQGLRTPISDRIMVGLTEMGDAQVTVPVIGAVLVWLLWRRAWRDALYWMAAAGFGALAVVAVKAVLRIPRPIDLYSGASVYSFPSGHATMTVIVYGFLAVLIAPSLRSQRRWIPYSVAALLFVAIAFSRLYLGAHWLADVAAGIGLGCAWVAVLAIARARHRPGVHPIPGLITVVVLVFAGSASWHIRNAFHQDLRRYAVRHAIEHMSAVDWWQGDWQHLPAYRLDLEGEHKQPLNVQWAGTLAQLRQRLRAHGWHPPIALSTASVLHMLLPNPDINQLPVPPRLHDGRYEALLLVHPVDTGSATNEQLALRLWPSSVRLRPGLVRLWVGTVSRQHIVRLPLVRFVHSAGDYDWGIQALKSALASEQWKTVQRAADAQPTILIRSH